MRPTRLSLEVIHARGGSTKSKQKQLELALYGLTAKCTAPAKPRAAPSAAPYQKRHCKEEHRLIGCEARWHSHHSAGYKSPPQTHVPVVAGMPQPTALIVTQLLLAVWADVSAREEPGLIMKVVRRRVPN